MTDPSGAITTYGYDSAGDLISIVDPLGRTTALTYATSTVIPEAPVALMLPLGGLLLGGAWLVYRRRRARGE